jgi:hypothetical protein
LLLGHFYLSYISKYNIIIYDSAELIGAQNIYLHQAELLGGQSLINDRLTLNTISNTIIQLEIMQVDQLSADTICTKQI